MDTKKPFIYVLSLYFQCPISMSDCPIRDVCHRFYDLVMDNLKIYDFFPRPRHRRREGEICNYERSLISFHEKITKKYFEPFYIPRFISSTRRQFTKKRTIFYILPDIKMSAIVFMILTKQRTENLKVHQIMFPTQGYVNVLWRISPVDSLTCLDETHYISTQEL